MRACSPPVQVTAYSRSSGLPILVETITLLSDMSRVRIVQRYGEGGAFQVSLPLRHTPRPSRWG
jgi:hypothetical protein